nr:unnamed protein product [Callosobruchus chinensis]
MDFRAFENIFKWLSFQKYFGSQQKWGNCFEDGVIELRNTYLFNSGVNLNTFFHQVKWKDEKAKMNYIGNIINVI